MTDAHTHLPCWVGKRPGKHRSWTHLDSSGSDRWWGRLLLSPHPKAHKKRINSLADITAQWCNWFHHSLMSDGKPISDFDLKFTLQMYYLVVTLETISSLTKTILDATTTRLLHVTTWSLVSGLCSHHVLVVEQVHHARCPLTHQHQVRRGLIEPQQAQGRWLFHTVHRITVVHHIHVNSSDMMSQWCKVIW